MAVNPVNPMPTTGLIPSAQTSGVQSQGPTTAPQRAGNSLSPEQYQALRDQISALPAEASEKLVLYQVIDNLDTMELTDGTPLTPEQRSVIETTVANASDNVKAFAAQIMDSFNPPAAPTPGDSPTQASAEGGVMVSYAPSKPKNLFERIAAALTMLFTGKSTPDSNQMITRPHSSFEPVGTNFSGQTPQSPGAPQGNGTSPEVDTAASSNLTTPAGPPMPAGELETRLYNAVKAYPNSKATDAEAQQIAKTVAEAGRTLQMSDANIEKMLAVFAHESGGFDADARSNTGAGGLGQLTGPALEEMDRLSNAGGPYASLKDRFVAPGGNRNDLQKNIWTSMAYMHNLMNEIGTDDISEAFTAYNMGPTGYREVSARAGSTDAQLSWIRQNISGVSPEQKLREFNTYAGLVDTAHSELFTA